MIQKEVECNVVDQLKDFFSKGFNIREIRHKDTERNMIIHFIPSSMIALIITSFHFKYGFMIIHNLFLETVILFSLVCFDSPYSFSDS